MRVWREVVVVGSGSLTVRVDLMRWGQGEGEEASDGLDSTRRGGEKSERRGVELNGKGLPRLGRSY